MVGTVQSLLTYVICMYAASFYVCDVCFSSEYASTNKHLERSGGEKRNEGVKGFHSIL